LDAPVMNHVRDACFMMRIPFINKNTF